MSDRFQVFISFKHLDESGHETPDSHLAREVYHYLTDRGLTVFLSTVSLEQLGIAAYKKVVASVPRTRENVDTFLRPNMFARVVIEGRPTGDIVHVPREAVIRGARLNRVVLDLGGGRFRSQPVVVGVESADRVAIRSGLTGDERVVVSGQFLIDSESNIGSALDRFDPAMGSDRGDSQ